MAKVVKVYESNSALAVTATAGTVELRTLDDFPDQQTSLADHATPEGRCIPLSLKYRLADHESDWQQLLRQKGHPDHMAKLAEFYFGLGVPTAEALKLANGPNIWYLSHGRGVYMGEISGIKQKLAFSMHLGQIYKLKAYRLSRKWPITNLVDNLFGYWQNDHESGIFVIENTYRSRGIPMVSPVEVVHPTEFAELLRQRFFETFPMAADSFLTKFTFASRADLRDMFPNVELSADEHHRYAMA